jgi:hypothetical protein
MKNMKKILLAGLALSLSIIAQAQTLEPDPTFGTNGITIGAIPGNYTQFYAIKKQLMSPSFAWVLKRTIMGPQKPSWLNIQVAEP